MKKIKVFYKGAYDDGNCKHYVYTNNSGWRFLEDK